MIVTVNRYTDPDSYTYYNNPRITELRGRKRLFTKADRANIYTLRELELYEANRLGWQGIAWNAGVTKAKEISIETIRRHIWPVSSHIPQQKLSLDPNAVKARLE